MSKTQKSLLQFLIAGLILLFFVAPALAQEITETDTNQNADQSVEPTTNTATNNAEVTAEPEATVVAEPTVVTPTPETVVAEPETASGEAEVTPEEMGVKEPTLLPDSPFYFLKEWARNIGTALTFDQTKKAERLEEHANQRLLELQKLVEKNPNIPKLIEKVLAKYDKDLSKLKDRIAKLKEKKAEQAEKFVDQELNRQRLLEKLKEKAQDPAVLDKVKDKSINRLVEVLKNINADKLEEGINKILENQDGQTKNLHNLEVLKKVEEKVSNEKAKEALQRAQGNALKRLGEELRALTPEQRREKVQEFLTPTASTETVAPQRLEVIKELENRTPQILQDLKKIRKAVEVKQEVKPKVKQEVKEQVKEQVKEKVKLKFSSSSCKNEEVEDWDNRVGFKKIREKNWLDETTLEVKAVVAINCVETIKGGDYEVIGNKIILKYRPSGCETCATCLCAAELGYKFTNLEKKDYELELTAIK